LVADDPAVWTTGPGLPAITSVARLSSVEFELGFANPIPLSAGYMVTCSHAVESATGEALDPGFRTATFSVTTQDLTIVALSWIFGTELDIAFSEPIRQLPSSMEFGSILQMTPEAGTFGRQVHVQGIGTSGAALRISLETPGTLGAPYTLTLNRDLLVSAATGVTLRAGQEVQTAYGQGQQPGIIQGVGTPTEVTLSVSEVLGRAPNPVGWPLFGGLYAAQQGSLGPQVSSPAPASIRFTEATLPAGTQPIGLATSTRLVATGQSFVAQASSSAGSGSETMAGSTTTLHKTSGAPYEVVFSGGQDSMSMAGRELRTHLQPHVTSDGLAYPLLAITFLNSQVSVVLDKTTANQGVWSLYRGGNRLARISAPQTLAAGFDLRILDATAEPDGFLAVVVGGVCVLGAGARDLVDPLLQNPGAGVGALALTLGSPSTPAPAFSIDFSSMLQVSTYLGVGFLGVDSRDLLDFGASQFPVVVSTSVVPANPGFQQTGLPAFGIRAEYIELVDAVQVVVGLNGKTQIPQFSGSVSLLTADQQVVDQVLVTEALVSVQDSELLVVFLHPKQWSGMLAGIQLTIGGAEYSQVVPVSRLGDNSAMSGILTQQPASWYFPRLNQQTSNLSWNLGPATRVG
jgi:hypothetical protein